MAVHRTSTSARDFKIPGAKKAERGLVMGLLSFDKMDSSVSHHPEPASPESPSMPNFAHISATSFHSDPTGQPRSPMVKNPCPVEGEVPGSMCADEPGWSHKSLPRIGQTYRATAREGLTRYLVVKASTADTVLAEMLPPSNTACSQRKPRGSLCRLPRWAWQRWEREVKGQIVDWDEPPPPPPPPVRHGPIRMLLARIAYAGLEWLEDEP